MLFAAFPCVLLTVTGKRVILFLYANVSYQSSSNKGGETGSTGVRKLKLHTEVPPGLVKKVGLNTNADDYAYAVAA
jgi:hypothetical protein